MVNKKLRVGIIGCGLISRLRHVPTYKKMSEQVELVSVCDQDEKLASELAKVMNDFPFPSLQIEHAIMIDGVLVFDEKLNS